MVEGIGPRNINPHLGQVAHNTNQQSTARFKEEIATLHPSNHKFQAVRNVSKNAMDTTNFARNVIAGSSPQTTAFKVSSLSKTTFKKAHHIAKSDHPWKQVEKEPSTGMNLFSLKSRPKVPK